MAKNTIATAAETVTNTAKNAAPTGTTAQLVTSTIEETQKVEQTLNANYVYVASSLQNGIKFNDLTSTRDGCFTFPGINNNCRGAHGGVLAPLGNAICVSVPRAVWEEIQRVYSHHPVFRHNPPYLVEMGDKNEFAARSRAGEFAELKAGFEPIDPNKPADKV